MPEDLLSTMQRRRHADSPAEPWIALAHRAAIETQVAALTARAARCQTWVRLPAQGWGGVAAHVSVIDP